jgi:hypothetical protein
VLNKNFEKIDIFGLWAGRGLKMPLYFSIVGKMRKNAILGSKVDVNQLGPDQHQWQE